MHFIDHSKNLAVVLAASILFLSSPAWAGSQAGPEGPAHEEKASEEHPHGKEAHGKGSSAKEEHAEDEEHHEGSRAQQPGSSSKETPSRGYE